MGLITLLIIQLIGMIAFIVILYRVGVVDEVFKRLENKYGVAGKYRSMLVFLSVTLVSFFWFPYLIYTIVTLPFMKDD